MARERGTFNFSASLEIKKEGALDARQVVQTKAELIQASTWLDDDDKIWLYNGLLVCVVADTDINNGVYFLTDKDNYTDSSNWIKISSISGSTPDELLEAINNALEEAKAYTDDKAGTVTFTGSNYITDSSNLTEAVVELDDQLENVRNTYLPLSGGKMTGPIGIAYNGLQTSGGNTLLFYNDTELWYGHKNYRGVWETSDTDLLHRKNDTNYTILDTSNFVAGTDYLAPGAVTIADISDLGSTWDSYLKAGVYNRNITVNGTSYPVMTNVSGATAINIYAPTAAGTSGQFLKSTGGTPSWNSITVADISNLNSTWDNFMTGSTLATRNILINGSAWTVYSSVGTDTTRIYAPTTMSTNSNQVLTGSSDGIPKWGYPNVVSVHDTRDTTSTPDEYTDKVAQFSFTNQELPDGIPTWTSKLSVKGWSAGYNVWELAGGSTNTLCENLAFRAGINDTWGDWHTIAFQDWTTAQLAGYLPLTAGSNKPLTGPLYINGYSDVGINQYALGLIVGDGTFTRGIEIRSHGCTLGLGSHQDGVIRFWRSSDDDNTFTGYFAEVDAANGGFHHKTNMFMGSNKHIALSTSSYLGIPASSTGACGIANSGVSESLNNLSLYFPGDTSMVVGNTNYTSLALRTNASSNLVHRKGSSDYTIYDESNLFPRTISFNNVNYDVKTTIATSQQQAFKFYAPTTAGASGQILQSTGGVPTWTNDNFFRQSRAVINSNDLDTFVSRTSGTYSIDLEGASAILAVLARQMGSASALEFYSNYTMSDFRVRTTIDDNKYNPWKYFVLSNSGTENIANYVKLNGDSFKPNNMCWGGTKTDGTTTCLAFINPENIALFGHTSLPLRLRSSSNPTVLVGTSTYTLLHTGNIGSIKFTGAVSATFDGTNDITVNIPTAGGGVADSVDWSNVTNKPSWIGSSKPSYSWSEITSKPSTFTPSAHTHTSSQITDLQDKLDQYYPKTGIGYLSFDSSGRPVMDNNQGYSCKKADGTAIEVLWINTSDQLIIGGTSSSVLTTIKFMTDNLSTYSGKQVAFVEDIPTSIAWNNVSGKPSWIGTSKPTYSYSEISGTVPSTDLPIATANTVGVIRVGAGLSINSSGVLSATGGGTADAVDWENVVGKPSWIGSTKPTYSYSEITGTIPIADIPTGTTSSTVALGNHTHSNYLTSSSLSGYATQTWVNSQIDAITPASIGAAASSHGHVFSDITFNNTGTNAQYLAGDGKFYTVGWNEIGSKPSSFTPSSHTHSASDITSGTLALARIPTGTTSSTVALGNHTHSNYLTSSSLSGYATQTWVNQQIAAIDIPDTSNFVTLNGTQTITGTKTFTQYTVFSNGAGTSSDKRLKRSIKPIENPFEILEGLTGYRYTLISNNAKSVGLIAQDVEKVLPEAVRTDDEGYKSVDTYPIVAVLVETIKELKKEIEELKSKL